ncbi:MAG: hypothetical protein V4492_05805 [Chlamydiota bacterium]
MSAESVTGSSRTSHTLQLPRAPSPTPPIETLGSSLDPTYLPTLQKCIVISARHSQAIGELRLVGQFSNASTTQTFWNYEEGEQPTIITQSSDLESLAISRFEILIPEHFESGLFEFKIARLNPHNQETSYSRGLNHCVELDSSDEISISPTFRADTESTAPTPDVDPRLELQRKAERALELVRRDPQLSGALEAGLNDPNILQSLDQWLPPLIDRLMQMFRDDPEMNSLLTEYSQAFLAAGLDDQFIQGLKQYLSSFQSG